MTTLLIIVIYGTGGLIMIDNIHKLMPWPDPSLPNKEFDTELRFARLAHFIGAAFWPMTAIVWLSDDDYKGWKQIAYWFVSWPVYAAIGAYFVGVVVLTFVVARKNLQVK
jgi:hypothetical protein